MTIFYHREYAGSCEYNKEDNVWHGKIMFIKELITYEAASKEELYEEFVKAVVIYSELLIT